MFDPKVVEVYSKYGHALPLSYGWSDVLLPRFFRVGQLLSRYRSGPLPKAFKILPSLPTWPALLELTAPESWTPHATYAATRIFASNLDPKLAQQFYRDILLPKVRDEIAEDKKLSVQTYMALKKSMYKPSAFFKGILFPLCQVLPSLLSRVIDPLTRIMFLEWYLHSEGSHHPRERDCQGANPRRTLWRSPFEAGRDGLYG
jgi:Bystin